jgi:hypothetical protein
MPTGSARVASSWPFARFLVVGGERRRTPTKKPVVPIHGLDVRYWHLADILLADLDVRFLPIATYEIPKKRSVTVADCHPSDLEKSYLHRFVGSGAG